MVRACRPLFAWLLVFAGTALAEQPRLPEPLDLPSALAAAAEPPSADGESAAALAPQRQPLYLDCRQLAFADTVAPDRHPDRRGHRLLSPLARRQLAVVTAYFDLLLSDLSFALYSETVAVAYVQWDRARERRELGQTSELRDAELQVVYREALHRRSASEAGQRLTRSRLARAMGRPGQLPSEVQPVAVGTDPGSVPELDPLVAAVERGNRWLADKRASSQPAVRRTLDLELRERVLALALRLSMLQDAMRHALADTHYRDLRLEKSRALYELELRGDLGYAMSRQSRARLRERRIGYCRLLAIAELQALQGRPPWPVTWPPTTEDTKQ